MLNPKQRISLTLSALLISSQVYAIDVSYQSHIKPSAVALDAIRHKGSNAPRVTQANNGIPVVDIADANNAGISNNYFTDFNVGKEGLIFNNSKDLFVNTTLAGYINGNSNLTNEASLILTQVTGSNPSSLLGVMEIAGRRADLIIANPNGITCNGCGVLNTKSFTLSTGVISQEEIDRVNNINEINKTLTMMTQRGHINIEALNASNVEKLNIIAKSASVNGNLLASDLQFILGENKVFFDLSNKSDASLLLYEAITTKNAEGEEQKALALDVAHLGSVVANSIYLVATDEGVGVKNSGTMATIGSKESGDGGFVIDVNGVVTISTPENGKSTLDKDGSAPTLSSSANLEIRAKELHNGSIISADTDVNITADKVENVSRYEVYWETTEYKKSGKTYYLPLHTNDWLQWKYNEHIVQEQRVKFETFSPAIIQAGNNLTITADSVKNDMGNLNATNEAVFNTTEKFENIGTLLQKRVTDKETRKTYNDGGKTHITSDYYVKIDAILPQFNIQDLVLSNQEAILSNALVFASTPTYTQEDRSEYTDLSSYLASSSYQEYVKSHYHRDPNYSDALLQKEIEFAVQKDTYRHQNAQAINTLFDNLERRLQETEEAKENINPNELSSVGISAENVRIEGGEITNSSLIEAGHIAVVGNSVINKNGTIVSRGDLDIQAGDFQNFGADLIAGNNLTINADSVAIGTKELKTENSENNSVTHIASNLSSKNISITSNGNATFTSVNMEATQDLLIKAKGDITFETAQDTRFNKSISLTSDVNIFKTTMTTTTTTTTTKTNIANSLKGNNISITAGNNLTGFNVKADATENLAMSAGNNLTLSTKADEKIIEEHKVEKSFGFKGHTEDNPIRKSVGVSLGYTETTTDTNTNIKTHNNQTLSANNITLSSGNKTALESVDTKSENISISGKDVTITALSDSYDQTIHKDTTTKTFGIGASLNTNAWGVNVGMGYEERETKYDKETHNTSTSSANINANNITITTADKKGNPQGSIDIIGSNLNGSEIALSGKDVNIKAHQTTNKTTESEETIISHRGGLNILGLGGGSILSGAGMYGILGDFFGLKPTSSSEKIASNKINTGSNLVGNNINITTANNKGTTKGNINIVGSSLSATNETNLTATNVNIKGSENVYINGGYGFGYDVLDSFNTPSILDIEAYAQAKANASLDTKVNNSSITSNTINITSEKPKYSIVGGNTTIAGGNLSGENININSGNNLTIKTQKEIHANLNAGMNVIAESMGSAGLVVPVDFRGNIENGESNKELKDALQINLSSSSGKQSDIQAGNLNIDTKNNTTLSGSHIGAENGTISTGILTEKELVHQGFQITQRLDDGRDIWGQYGSPIKGVFTMDQILKVINAGGDIKNKPFESLDKIGDSLRLGDFNLKGNMSLSKATHQATISQGIDIKTTNTKKPSSEIKRGEAQSQSQMQITKSQSEDTNVKKLAEDVIGLVNGINKITKDKK